MINIWASLLNRVMGAGHIFYSININLEQIMIYYCLLQYIKTKMNTPFILML